MYRNSKIYFVLKNEEILPKKTKFANKRKFKNKISPVLWSQKYFIRSAFHNFSALSWFWLQLELVQLLTCNL
jgi:hypothetical protein